MTVTDIAADIRALGVSGSKAGRRLLAVSAMLLGALIGAELVLHGRATVALAIALLTTAVVAAAVWGVRTPASGAPAA